MDDKGGTMHPSIQNETIGQRRLKAISDGVASITTTYIESASGAILKDVEGNEFIDFGGGIGVMGENPLEGGVSVVDA